MVWPRRSCEVFQVGSVVKNLPANAGDARDVGSIPGSGRSPGEGNGNPSQYSCLENPIERGPWRIISSPPPLLLPYLSPHHPYPGMWDQHADRPLSSSWSIFGPLFILLPQATCPQAEAAMLLPRGKPSLDHREEYGIDGMPEPGTPSHTAPTPRYYSSLLLPCGFVSLFFVHPSPSV